MKNSRYSIFLILLFFFTFGQAQNELKIDSLLKKAHAFYKTNLDSALYYSNIAHEKAKKIDGYKELGKVIAYKTTYLLSQRKFNEAKILLQQNLDNKKQMAEVYVGDTYANLGAIYALTEQRDLALEHYFDAIDIFTKLNENSRLARKYLNVGVIFQKENKKKKADYFYDKSLFYSKLAKNNVVSSIHENVNTLDKTSFETKLKLSNDVLNDIENPLESRLASVIYHDMSKNYIDNRRYKEAIESAQTSIKIKNNIGYYENLDFSYFIIGKSHVRLGHNDEGIKKLEKAISISQKRELKIMMYDMMILAYKNKRNYKKAFDLSEQLNTIKDSLSLIQENERIAEITAQYETEKQAKEILILKQENQENELLITQKESSMWKWSLFALLVTIVSIFLGKKLLSSLKKIKTVELEKEEIAKKVEEIAVILNNKSKIYLDKLKYIKSDGNYLEFVTNDKTIIDRNKLKDILDDLPPNFVRVHRSYVINKNFIDALNSTTLYLKSNIEIPLSRTFKSNIT